MSFMMIQNLYEKINPWLLSLLKGEHFQARKEIIHHIHTVHRGGEALK